MNKYTLLVALFIITLSKIYSFPIDFFGLEMSERGQISKFRHWHPYVLYNTDLMDLAKQEAIRLANLGRLEAPTSLKLGNRYFVGHAKRVTGFDVDLTISKFNWIGERICFNNLNDQLNYTIIVDANRICDDLGVIYEQFYAVGFGIAGDLNGVGYVVRLFLTNQMNLEHSNITIRA